MIFLFSFLAFHEEMSIAKPDTILLFDSKTSISYEWRSFYLFLETDVGMDIGKRRTMGFYNPLIGCGYGWKGLKLAPILLLPISSEGISRKYGIPYAGKGIEGKILLQGKGWEFSHFARFIYWDNGLMDGRWGFGVFFPLRGISPGVKLQGRSFLFSDTRASVQYLGMCLRIAFLDFSAFFRISDPVPSAFEEYGIFPEWKVQFSFLRRRKKEEIIPEKTLTLYTLDREKKTPLPSIVSIEGVGSVFTDSTGISEISLPPGVYRFTVISEGYKDIDTLLSTVDEDILVFYLEKKPPLGWLSGEITDEEGNGIKARVILPEAGIETTSDPITGIYLVPLPPGNHIVRVEAPGFMTCNAVVTIEKGEWTIRNFAMKRK